MESVPFREWTDEDVELTFGIKRKQSSKHLTDWVNADNTISDRDLEDLRDAHATARLKIDSWNENTLKFLFISRLITMVNFADSEAYNAFTEQTLTVEDEGIMARGNVDFMVATGRLKARAPYYLLHEYKPEKYFADPRGQLLVAMLAADRRNREEGKILPIYGNYIMGRFWFPVVFYNNEYCVGDPLTSTDFEQLKTIYRTLLYVKEHIEQLISIDENNS